MAKMNHVLLSMYLFLFSIILLQRNLAFIYVFLLWKNFGICIKLYLLFPVTANILKVYWLVLTERLQSAHTLKPSSVSSYHYHRHFITSVMSTFCGNVKSLTLTFHLQLRRPFHKIYASRGMILTYIGGFSQSKYTFCSAQSSERESNSRSKCHKTRAIKCRISTKARLWYCQCNGIMSYREERQWEK